MGDNHSNPTCYEVEAYGKPCALAAVLAEALAEAIPQVRSVPTSVNPNHHAAVRDAVAKGRAALRAYEEAIRDA